MFQYHLLQSDAAACLAALHRCCFSNPWDISFFKEKLHTTCVSYGAFAQDKLVGFIFAQVIEGEGEILTFCVLPELRGQGVGSRLLEFFLKQSKIENCFLEVKDENKAAIALYERAGFKKKGVRQGYYAQPGQNSQDAILYHYSKKEMIF